MKTVTLDYLIPIGLQASAVAIANAAAANIFRGELDMLGFTVGSDTTILLNPTTVRRRVVLQSTALGDANFPSDKLMADATRTLYRDSLSGLLTSNVQASEPVVT